MPNIRKHPVEKAFLPMRMYHIIPEEALLIDRVHHHTAIEICCVISGSGTMETQTEIYPFGKGDVFVFSPGEMHRISGYSEDTDVLVLGFEPYYMWSTDSGFSGTRLLDTFLARSTSYTNRLSGDICAYVYGKTVEIEEELINFEPEYESFVRIKLAEILIHLHRYSGFALNSSISESRKYNLENLKLSMEYIDNNLEKELELEQLAEHANMSKSYFCTVFKRYNGIKPWDYITIKRVDMALRLLPHMSEKKLNIAMDCGFNNTANFYRAFKKITGRPPGDYV